MSKGRKLLVILLSLIVLVGIIIIVVIFLKPEGAGLSINTTPASNVFINGEQVGRTPYTTVKSPGEIELRLIPDSFDTPLIPYERKLTLVSGVETMVQWEFGSSLKTSKGEIVSFEKLPNDDTSIAVISDPTQAEVILDGVRQGFTPYKNDIAVEGEHSLIISAKGYKNTELGINVVTGYLLTAEITLIPDENYVDEEIPETKEPTVVEDVEVKKVEILSTPTNFLRVRSDPSSTASEIGRVIPGRQYEVVEEREEEDWIKIKFDDSEGWVSVEYIQFVEPETTAAGE